MGKLQSRLFKKSDLSGKNAAAQPTTTHLISICINHFLLLAIKVMLHLFLDHIALKLRSKRNSYGNSKMFSRKVEGVQKWCRKATSKPNLILKRFIVWEPKNGPKIKLHLLHK